MKIRFHFILILFCSFFGCKSDSSSSNSPEEIAREWISLINQQEYSQLKLISLGRGLQFAEEMEILFKDIPLKKNNSFNIKKMNCVEKSDKLQSCKYCCNQGEEETLILQLVNDHWKVADIIGNMESLDEEELKNDKNIHNQLNRKLHK